MTQYSDAIEAVRDLALDPNSPIVPDAQLLQDDRFNNLLALCHTASNAERNDILAALAPVITQAPDAFQASRVAMLCGILVEWGADPALAIGAILAKLEAALDLPSASAIRFLVMPAMTMLCASVNARQQARHNANLMQRIQAVASTHREVNFLQRLFHFTDGEELIILHAHNEPRPSGSGLDATHSLTVAAREPDKGFRVRLEAVATNFHLFSLLQDALVGEPATGLLHGPRPNRKVIAVAKGEASHDRLIADGPVWHFADWTETAIVGEATPRDIPQFEGERVILLGPPAPTARGWDSSFFTNLHDALRSQVEVVEILSADEVTLRLRRIGKARRDMLS